MAMSFHQDSLYIKHNNYTPLVSRSIYLKQTFHTASVFMKFKHFLDTVSELFIIFSR